MPENSKEVIVDLEDTVAFTAATDVRSTLESLEPLTGVEVTEIDLDAIETASAVK